MPTGIRTWGDEFSPTFQQSLNQAGPEVVAAYGAANQPTAALAISGGGSNGVFAAGLLCGWTRHGDRPVFRLVTGISAGAIVAPFAFLGSQYDEQLQKFAAELDDQKVFKKKGFLAAFGSDSLEDTQPLAKFLATFYDEKLLKAVAAEGHKGRRLFVVTTDLDAQRPVLWDLTRVAETGGPSALETFRQVILASAATPVLFPPVYLKVIADGKTYDEMHVDGGVATQVILYGQVIHLPKLINEHAAEQRRPPPTVDVYVILNEKLVPQASNVKPRLLDIASRSVEMLVKGQGVGDLYQMYDMCVRDGLKFHLAVIPADAPTNPRQGFNAGIIHKLFQCGTALGSNGYPWASKPPHLQPSTQSAGQLP